MTMRLAMSSHLPLVVAGIAVILFSTAGIARMMGWGLDLLDDSGDILALDRAESVAVRAVRAGPKCTACGVIVSMREIEWRVADAGPGLAAGESAGNWDETQVRQAVSYEITVRMADGTSREINHANPANWRPGERVVIIDGADPSGR